MKIKLLTLCSLCLAVSAYANEQKPVATVLGLSFDDIRVACQNPARFHNQAAPSNIQISCRDIQNKWVPDTDGAYTMPTARLITSSIYSDKYTVAPQSATVQSASQVVSCARFKEVAETVETVRAVSCDELVAFNGTSIDFCSAAINSLRSINQEAISSQETGRLSSLCETAVNNDQSNGQVRGQRGQR